jgi:hypothetical protein
MKSKVLTIVMMKIKVVWNVMLSFGEILQTFQSATFMSRVRQSSLQETALLCGLLYLSQPWESLGRI